MRKVSSLLGLTVLALAVPARAAETVPAAVPPTASPTVATETSVASPSPSGRRFEIAVSYLPMARGKITSSLAGMTETVDSTFGSGVGLSASVDVFHGLMVGIAPQAIFKGKVKAKPDGTETTFGSDKQIDLMLRVAYAYAIPGVVTLYAEVLPGYSTISSDVTDTSKGLVLAYGIGAELDVAKRVFANLGIGYEMGFQKVSSTSIYRHDYVRAAIGVGTRF
jgi:hypothetical protein